VYCHIFITTRVTLDLKSPAMGIVLRILHTLMFAAIVERPRVQGWALKATSSRGTAVDGESFVLYLQPYVALRRHSQLSILWDKTSQHHLTSLAAAVVTN